MTDNMFNVVTLDAHKSQDADFSTQPKSMEGLVWPKFMSSLANMVYLSRDNFSILFRY